jgi:hypothetical protein
MSTCSASELIRSSGTSRRCKISQSAYSLVSMSMDTQARIISTSCSLIQPPGCIGSIMWNTSMVLLCDVAVTMMYNVAYLSSPLSDQNQGRALHCRVNACGSVIDFTYGCAKALVLSPHRPRMLASNIHRARRRPPRTSTGLQPSSTLAIPSQWQIQVPICILPTKKTPAGSCTGLSTHPMASSSRGQIQKNMHP